jgi:hypothetical protein
MTTIEGTEPTLSPKPEMPLAPFQRWLNRKVELLGARSVADTIGVDEARVRCVLRGEYHSHGKPRKMQFVTLRLVDEWATALGDHYLEIYPDMADTEAAAA